MTVRLYDSKAQALVDFVPLREYEVGMYVCGPTVQSSPHIGHLRSALAYDQLRRWLHYRGYRVTLIRNVTDIDDKILAAAEEAGRGDLESHSSEQWWALAYRMELEFTAAYTALGILPPTYEPRATASIAEMVTLIRCLVELGHAYPAPDGSGDVYFDTRSWPDYGALTGQRLEDMEAALDADPRGKRDSHDFALWKGAKPEEPESASWFSPWGRGRPGWHIECSAMATKYLGAQFDIHGGGLDLRFPHHENELAQSNAAGKSFARYWLHNGLVSVTGQKMSKSLGNSIFASELLTAARPLVLRYYLGSAHYRSTLEFHDGALKEAEAALERIEGFLDRSRRRLSGTRFAAPGEPVLPDEFAGAMDDDLSVPQAIAVLHETVRAGNAALDAEDLGSVSTVRAQVLEMTAVLGINPEASEWARSDDEPTYRALRVLVDRLVAERQSARERRDWTSADRIRNDLVAAGITVEDTQTGAHWSLDAE
ncbi:cysteine--tRNA ligase [Rathayibacter toxicus]|uniref:Cysteine--tRNA ligase n=1 Tax=Rathayibacter toxicus TaxID=145458 RepID=A0A0C5BG02_9MICO|nr:cysteine--tRNA ligase [Rathayibacter toxicus]AJM78331.1 cysteinyl-tRNA synthetase [Rathayibacter toxicus]ALS58244.1 cysteine--tRNA ligase [Rathayibacter toxicus]KKM46449.1 cysteinyl-tRNA synthetase [Rathayibacter toxicus]PPG23423.1 cysteine--tRNA ligase [Rathayibacter toxicus]PPG48007.1 cysteine--tRNA ligase [Rathayibacter toxicus]